MFRRVDRVDGDGLDLAGAVERIGREALNAVQGIDAGRRVDVGLAQAAIGFVAQDLVGAQIRHQVIDLDVPVIDRDVEIRTWRPDGAHAE
ncbi:hypothetical protein D3C72_1709620 [compost metagenome]